MDVANRAVDLIRDPPSPKTMTSQFFAMFTAKTFFSLVFGKGSKKIEPSQEVSPFPSGTASELVSRLLPEKKLVWLHPVLTTFGDQPAMQVFDFFL